jgi:hypothetical protein
MNDTKSAETPFSLQSYIDTTASSQRSSFYTLRNLDKILDQINGHPADICKAECEADKPVNHFDQLRVLQDNQIDLEHKLRRVEQRLIQVLGYDPTEATSPAEKEKSYR